MTNLEAIVKIGTKVAWLMNNDKEHYDKFQEALSAADFAKNDSSTEDRVHLFEDMMTDLETELGRIIPVDENSVAAVVDMMRENYESSKGDSE